MNYARFQLPSDATPSWDGIETTIILDDLPITEAGVVIARFNARVEVEGLAADDWRFHAVRVEAEDGSLHVVRPTGYPEHDRLYTQIVAAADAQADAVLTDKLRGVAE